jgi:predicted chitinase
MSDLDKIIEAVPTTLRNNAKQAIPAILAACESAGVTDRAQIAYILATAQHESNFKPIREIWGPNQVPEQKRYDAPGNHLGNAVNSDPNANYTNGEGYLYRGRGYVQVTGHDNYANWSNRLGVDLVGNPDAALKSNNAARILVEGMRDGAFRNQSLDTYINGSERDFENARGIINGDKNKYNPVYRTTQGEGIALAAEKYYQVLKNLDLSRTNGNSVLENKLTADVSDKPSNLLQQTEKSTPKREFLQAAQLILDKRGHLEGDTQVYRGYTYTFQKQADTLTAHKHGHEILKQVGSQVVIDRVTPSDVKVLNTVTQNLEKLEQQSKDFAKASQTILESRGHLENGTQVFKGNIYSFEKTGDTLTVQKQDREIFKQVGNQVVHSQLTAQDVGILSSVAQTLEDKGKNVSQKMSQSQTPVGAGLER